MSGSAPHCLKITAPSRLHFGLLSFGVGSCHSERGASSHAERGEDPRAAASEALRCAQDDITAQGGIAAQGDVAHHARRFGGAGVMIERPGLLLRITAGDGLSATGPTAQRAIEFARRFAIYHRLAQEPNCRIDVVQLPRQHVGLGVGTSLGMAVAAGLARWLELLPMSAEQLAASVGRGRRSAVGAHGFVHGGLIVEGGKSAADDLSPLVARVGLLEAWRFVLIIPPGQGASGIDEENAFQGLPPVPSETSASLRDELMNCLLPAARNGDFEGFSESLYRFNRAAGECYAACQGGPYASGQVAELVAAVRAAGIRGVGQSSWGPTVFALLPDQASADALVKDFAGRPMAAQAEWIITPPSVAGASCSREFRG
jgi:beta-RFAP synthase